MVGTRGAVGVVVGSRLDAAFSRMLMFVVAEVLLRRDTGFVRAVRRSRAPDKLERHDKQ